MKKSVFGTCVLWGVCFAFLCSDIVCQEIEFVGVGKAANWNKPGNWRPTSVPNENQTAILAIDKRVVVLVENNAGVYYLKIGNDDEITLRHGTKFVVRKGIENSNLFRMESQSDDGSISTDLLVTEEASITGNGILRMSVFKDNRIVGRGEAASLTNGPEHWISGSGQLGANSLKFVNDGVIEADQSIALTVDPVDHLDFGAVNNNQFVASNGGNLQLAQGNYDNRLGRIIAKKSSTVTLLTGASVLGGAFESENDGRFVIPNGQSPRIDSITNNASVYQESQNEGGGLFTDAILDSEFVTLSGNGLWRMSNYSNNRIYSFSPGWTLVNGDRHTIAGSGEIGVNFMRFTNKGIVRADQSVPLRIDPCNDGDEFTLFNQGHMIATKNAKLELAGGRYDNRDGKIIAKDRGTVVFLSGASIYGGVLEMEDDGKFLIPNSSHPFLESITNNATVLQNSQDARQGQFTDVLLRSNTVSLDGNGTWQMSESVNNRILGTSSECKLVNGPKHTIRGSGQIGANFMSLVNNGTIIADQISPLTLDPFDSEKSQFVNNNVLLAADGGELRLAAGTFKNDRGKIVAGEGSTVSLLTGATLSGGSLENEGSGYFTIPHGQAPRLKTLFNNALVKQQARPEDAESDTDVVIEDGICVLDGSGIWRMTNCFNNRFVGASSNSVLVNGGSHTIAGSGQIGANSLVLENKGGILADQETPLRIDPIDGESPSENSGVLIAANGGELQLARCELDNSEGELLAKDKSKISFQDGLAIRGGTLENEGNGYISIQSGKVHLGSITNNAIVDQSTASTTNQYADVLLDDPEVVVDGNGTWRLSGGSKTRIYGFHPDWVLTNGSEHTISGSGQIGLNFMGIKNEGRLIADQTEPIELAPSDIDMDSFGSDFLNSGELVAAGSGGLILHAADYRNQPTGQIKANSRFVLTGGARLSNLGAISGTGEIVVADVNSIMNEGVISPGDEIGEMTISGGFHFDEPGSFKIDIQSNSDCDRLIVAGELTLGGAIEVQLHANFFPDSEQRFTIINAKRIANEFAENVVGTQRSKIANAIVFFDGGQCSIEYTNDSVVLTNFQATAAR